MATAEDLKKQIEALQQQLKDLNGKKMVYAKDRKFGKLNKETDVCEWIQDMGDYIKTRFSDEHEKVMFILDHLERDARTEVRFRAQVDKATADEILQILTDLYGSTDSLVQLQQQFYCRNQVSGESLQEYALDLMTKMNVIVEKEPSLRNGKEETMKQKFAEGVLDLNLRRELRRWNEERSKMKFWELRQHAITWKGEPTQVAAEPRDMNQATSQGMKYTDVCHLLEKQQKQIEDLAMVVKDLKGNRAQTDSDSKSDTTVKKKALTCYYCKKEGHIKANCLLLKGRRSNLNFNNPVAK